MTAWMTKLWSRTNLLDFPRSLRSFYGLHGSFETNPRMFHVNLWSMFHHHLKVIRRQSRASSKFQIKSRSKCFWKPEPIKRKHMQIFSPNEWSNVFCFFRITGNSKPLPNHAWNLNKLWNDENSNMCPGSICGVTMGFNLWKTIVLNEFQLVNLM